MTNTLSFTQLCDTDLLGEVKTLAADERRATARLIAALAEIDERRLYLPQGCRSMFTFCTEVLHLSEYAAYSRIEAARAVRRFPCILSLLEAGSITLTTVGLLAAHLTDDNHERVLASATRKSKRQVEDIVAGLRPKPPVPAVLRKLPTAAGTASRSRQLVAAAGCEAAADREAAVDCEAAGECEAARKCEAAPIEYRDRMRAPQFTTVRPVKPATIAPLSPERYKLQLTISKEAHDKLRRVQDLMRHTNPTGDPAVIFDRAIAMLLNSLEKAKLGATDRPRRSTRASSGKSYHSSKSRHIPAAVKRDVLKRDGRRCGFVGDAGRCTETGGLEYHHVVPFADGGAAIASNIQLRCRAHNGYEAEQWFGPLVVREARPAYEPANWVRNLDEFVGGRSRGGCAYMACL
jgi:5-methylcytosine-specific restriction endonuclease McrA